MAYIYCPLRPSEIFFIALPIKFPKLRPCAYVVRKIRNMYPCYKNVTATFKELSETGAGFIVFILN